VVIAHGIQAPGDPVFHAFSDIFSKLNEQEFISFWCIYLVSLAHEQFIKSKRYTNYVVDASKEISTFIRACNNANIPDIKASKSLRDILQWALHVLETWRPSLKYKTPEDLGEFELDLFGQKQSTVSLRDEQQEKLIKYINEINSSLDAVLKKCNLSLWLMVDRLDEIFPRRSDIERNALRGLLRAMRYFATDNIRVKVFLRDDMLDQVVRSENGFTALTHITARQADTLRWTEDQILTMLVKRIFYSDSVLKCLNVNRDQLEASVIYRKECFYKIFPPTVFRGTRQSPTLRWIYNRCADGRGAVTPRDVIDLLNRAKQKQHDMCAADPEGNSEWLLGSAAIQYGLDELSTRKRQTYLQAEFPHLWMHIEKFIGGKTDYDEESIKKLFGKSWIQVTEDLASIGLISKKAKSKYSIPYLYRHGLNLTQGKA
jgi:hypothetical protein